MNKHFASLITVFIAASGLFFSCGNKANNNVGAFEFDSISLHEQAYLFGDTAKPACDFTLSLEYITQGNDAKLKDSVNSYLLSIALGSNYQNMKPIEAADAYKQKYVKNYLNDLEPIYLEEEKECKANNEEIGSWYNYYKGVKAYTQFYNKQLLVYRVDYNEYTGGAHGIYTSTFLNLDLRTLTPIHLDDLFVNDYKEALTDLLWNQLMADNQVATREELEEMGYASTGELEPTDNFYLSKEGITFYYNVYEITPYAMGAVAISLPYEAFQHLVSDNKDILNSVK